MNKKADELVKRLDIKVDVAQNLENYSLAIQQMIAIARAVDMDCKALILDEPPPPWTTARWTSCSK